MNRHYYLRGQLIEVEELDGVVAVQQTDTPDASPSFGRSAARTVRAALPELEPEALEAFAANRWQFVTPNAELRAARDEGATPEAAAAVGSVVVHEGRVAILTDLLNVQIEPSYDEAAAVAVIEDAGLVVVNKLNFAPNLYEVRNTQGDAIDASVALNDDARFLFAEPSLIEHIPPRFTPTDPEFVNQWQWANSGAGGGTAGADVSAEEAWDFTFGAGIRVAVIDNGFDAGHEDLNPAGNSGFFVSGTPSTFTQGTGSMPGSNHGTFCAGMVAAQRGNGDGGVGAAPDATLMLVACLGDQVGTQTTLARAVAYSANPSTEVTGADPATGADIIVSSLGPNGAVWLLTTTLDLALQGAATNGRGGRGCAIFWAASNGDDVDVLMDQVVSHADVIAVVNSNRNDIETPSARGAEVELIAPGTDVVSTMSGDAYGANTGTSFAAPCAAGCAALALSINPALTRNQLRQIMRDTADQIGGVVYDAAGHNDDYGFGRVNAFEAVKAAGRRIQLITPSVVFNDVPAGETTARAVVWEVAALEPLTFEVVTGPTTLTGAANSFQLLIGGSVTVPTPGVGVTTHARIWLINTGTAAGNTATGQIVVRCVQTGEQWTVSLSANTIERPTAAVVMVMDQSGSMDWAAGDGRTRVEVLRESAAVLVDLLKPDTGIGVVRFDHDAYPIMNVVDAGPEVFGPGRAQATAAVASHVPNPNGATSIGDGAVAGGAMLDVAAPNYDTTAMIVLTDGQETAPAYIADVAGTLDDKVFAIGLGEPGQINPAALTALTNGTGGYVSMTGVLSSDEQFLLAKYYMQILAGVTNEQIVLDPDGYLKGGDAVKIPFELTRGDSTADVIMLASAPEVIDFTLVTPAGEVITPATPGVTFVTGDNVAYYRFTLPVVDAAGGEHWGGTWTAYLECNERRFWAYANKLEGSDIKAYETLVTHGLRWLVEVHSRSSLTMTASLEQKDITPGSTMYLSARLSEFGIPIDDDRAYVRAELTGPNGFDVVKLAGQGGGLFTAEYVAKDYGVYRFRVVAEGLTLRGERFTREQLVSGSIYEKRAPEGDPEPPKDDPRDPKCPEILATFVSVIHANPRLARALEAALQQQGLSLDAVLKCVERCASKGGVVIDIGHLDPPVVRPPIVRPPVVRPPVVRPPIGFDGPNFGRALADALRAAADAVEADSDEANS